jgi:hypothetical protein
MTATDELITVHGGGLDVRFSLWRHGAPAVRAMPGMHLGDRVLGPDVVDEARRIHESGARFVSIEREVDLGGRPGTEHVIPVLSFVRELTSYGVEVEWRARVAPGGPEWWVFGHLFPPTVLDGPRGPEALAVWRARYHVGRCFLRRGPGFVQIRDRRHAGLRRLTVSDGPTLAAMDPLLADRPAASLPDRTRSVFEQQRLLVRIGGGVWWAPYRLRRWAVPSWEV